MRAFLASPRTSLTALFLFALLLCRHYNMITRDEAQEAVILASALGFAAAGDAKKDRSLL